MSMREFRERSSGAKRLASFGCVRETIDCLRFWEYWPMPRSKRKSRWVCRGDIDWRPKRVRALSISVKSTWAVMSCWPMCRKGFWPRTWLR